MVKKLRSPIHCAFTQNWKSATGLLFSCLFLLIASSAYAQPPGEAMLFADINKTGSEEYEGPISELTYANGLAFFIRRNNLWTTDGTAAGTRPLISEVSSLSGISHLTSCGDRLYFVADGGAHGMEVWWTDGNDYGALNVNPTLFEGSSPTNLKNINGTLYFSASNGVTGKELWKAWGGREDFAQVADVLRGSGGSNPSEFEEMGGAVYFTANDGTNGYELWKTNGTSAGTMLVKDVRTGSKLSSTPKELTNVNGTLFFTAFDAVNGRELWKSNGTAAGTVFVKDIRPGSLESLPDNLTAVGSTLYFGANNGTNGRELWKSDGTAAGTVLVKDITVGSGSNAGGGYPHLSYFTPFNGKLYFMAYTDRPRLWTSDGTSAGTIPVTPLDRHFVSINPNVTVFNGSLYYVTNDNVEPDRGTMEIWKTDGTPSNHEQVRSGLGVWLNTDMELTLAGSRMYFTTWSVSGGSRENLWYTDGTNAGTQQVPLEFNTAWGRPEHLTTMGDAVYFSADDGIHIGLFKTDGSSVTLVKEVPGRLSNFYESNGLLYFVENVGDAPEQRNLWRSDGTTAGTYFLATLSTSPVTNFETINNGVVFFTFSNHLWRTNGTPAGTFHLRDFVEPVGWIASSGEELLIAGNDGVRGRELWRSNGTVAGTVFHRDIAPGSASSLLADMERPNGNDQNKHGAVTVNGVVYFLANAGGDANYELWRSDGTGGTGTRLIKNDETGLKFNPINGLAAANGHVFFFTYEPAPEGSYIQKYTLWSSNGTTIGTTPLREILNDYSLGDMYLTYFGSGGADFYFLTTVYLEPATLYASNGTAAGTELIYQFGDFEHAGPVHTAFDGEKTYINSGHMYDKFQVRSDGTACGTSYVPMYPVAYTTMLEDFWIAVLDGQLYMNGYSQQVGGELFRYTDDYVPCASTTVARVAAEEQAVPVEKEAVEFKAYPNPFVQNFSVSMEGDDLNEFSMEVTGMDGTPVVRENNLQFNRDYTFGDNWKPGIYLVKIRRGDSVTMHRLLKK
jgi:ELWxxDGT repeat protein